MEKKTSKSRQRKKWRWTAGCGLVVVAGLIGGLYAKSQTCPMYTSLTAN